MDHPDMAGRSDDLALDTWVFSQGRSAIASVYAGGRRVVENGRHIHRSALNARYSAVLKAIRARLEADILAGIYKPGEKLPNETDLAAEWNCARMTVGRALSALAEAGMVQRRKRAGTFVARRTVQETVLEIRDI
eukprot:gene34096-35064_t